MKKIILTFIALILAGIIYLANEGSEIRYIKTEIDISAPPSEVWNIVASVDKWHEWSPTMNASDGIAAVGSELSITMTGKKEGQDGPKYNPIITDLKEPNYFRWRAHMLSEYIFTNEKIIELEETNSGGTRLTHTESFKGLLAPLFSRKMENDIPPMLISMNRALKKLAEK